MGFLQVAGCLLEVQHLFRPLLPLPARPASCVQGQGAWEGAFPGVPTVRGAGSGPAGLGCTRVLFAVRMEAELNSTF